MKLVLIRHGETDLNKDGLILGLTNAPLNDTGRIQAVAVSNALIHEFPFILYTIPLPRALETACIISSIMNINLTPLDGLQEADAGDLDELNPTDISDLYPTFAKQWRCNPGTARMPGGESLVEVQKRGWETVMQMISGCTTETVVAVTHNFLIRTIVCKALDIPLKNFRQVQLDLGSMTQLDLSSRTPILLSLNDTSHFKTSDLS